MEFTAKGGDSLLVWMNVLEEEGFMPVKIENGASVNVPEERFAEFALITSATITYHAFLKIITDYNRKKGFDEAFSKNILEHTSSYFYSTRYWITLTNVLIVDYLKNKSTIHLDGFALFNMKGFKKEILTFVESYLDCDDAQDEEEPPAISSFNSLFEYIQQHADQESFSFEPFKELHIFEEGEGMRIENKDRILIDPNFFYENLGVSFSIDSKDPTVSQALLDSVYLEGLIKIFGSHEIVTHEGLSLAIEQELDEIIRVFKGSVNVKDCNETGTCEICEGLIN